MADSTITGLPAAATLTGAEVLPVVQSGSDVKTTVTAVSDFAALSAGISPQNIVQRLVNFQNGTGATTTLYNQNGYTQINGNTVNLTQAIYLAISGYENAIPMSWLTLATTGTTTPSAVVRQAAVTGAGGQFAGQMWTTGTEFQTILYASLVGILPDGSNDFEYRYGFFYDGCYTGTGLGGGTPYALDPFASIDAGPYDGAAAYFCVDKNSANWQCKSGNGVNTETTVTAVAGSVNIMRAFRIKISTTGVVQFWIDGTLVATHSGNGVIPTQKQLSEAFSVFNRAGTASSSSRAWATASIGFRAVLPSARTGFSFV